MATCCSLEYEWSFTDVSIEMERIIMTLQVKYEPVDDLMLDVHIASGARACGRSILMLDIQVYFIPLVVNRIRCAVV